MAKKNWIDKLFNLLFWFQRGIALFGIILILFVTIKKGIESGNTNDLILYLLVGFVASVIIGLVYFGFTIWNMTYDWLTIQLGKYVKIRRGIIFSFEIIALIIATFLVINVQMDNLLRAVIVLYFLLMLPSAITSVLQEDRMREQYALIGSQIPSDLIAQNPQAAVEYAFTLFEDHLRKRLGVNTDIYGENLINLAYGKEGKLAFGSGESDRQGVRNFISGAYSVYRNPRKHQIIKDDRLTTLEIISTVELLLRLIDESIENPKVS